MLAMLFGCGFRRSELVGLEMDEVQMRQGHWVVVDLIGKGRAYPNCPGSAMGQIRGRSLDDGGGHHEWTNLSGGRQDGKGVGRRHLAKCRVVRSQNLL